MLMWQSQPTLRLIFVKKRKRKKKGKVHIPSSNLHLIYNVYLN